MNRCRIRRASPLAAALAALLLLGGCSGVAEQEAATAAAAFVTDPAAGCDRLAPDTAEALQKRGTDCGTALAGFAGDAAALQVEVAGESAFVRFPDQVVFLARFPQGWLVTAAGCVREDADPAAPYECEVQP